MGLQNFLLYQAVPTCYTYFGIYQKHQQLNARFLKNSRNERYKIPKAGKKVFKNGYTSCISTENISLHYMFRV